MNRKIILIAALVLSVAMATGGTLAYLTDRDGAANVFTLGNVSIRLDEDFQQGASLMPGTKIEKVPTITNTGVSDAWVWLTFSIPAELDNWNPDGEEGSSQNVVHWNPLGATTVGYVTAETVAGAIEKGYLPAGTTAEQILANKTTWDVFNKLIDGGNAFRENINVGGREVPYNTYVLPYSKALKPGETTLPGIYRVYMDAQVDVMPNGDLYKVVEGVSTQINWNLNTDGVPVIFASAYAIQQQGFETMEQAFAAYKEQWGDKGNEYAAPVTVTNVSTFAELKKAFEKDGVVVLNGDITVEEMITIPDGCDVTLNMNGKKLTISDDGIDPMIKTLEGSSLIITGNGVFDMEDHYFSSVIAPYGDVTIENGSFIRDRSETAEYGSMTIGISGGTGKLIINGGYFDGGYYKEGDCYHNCIYNLNASWDQYVRVYGGTFVGQNPAWGDEGMADLCPHCTDTDHCQSIFLEGQTKTDTQIPAAYTITEGVTDDGRPTYTVHYSK